MASYCFWGIPPIWWILPIVFNFGNANIVIKVAHLQPNNPNIIHEPQVLEMWVKFEEKIYKKYELFSIIWWAWISSIEWY